MTGAPAFHYEILDDKRRNILPVLRAFKSDFYLAGGTDLALQIGHRDSVDFDFFTGEPLETQVLFEKCRKLFSGQMVQKIQEEKNTLSVIVDGEIKLSFLSYAYPVLALVEDDNFRFASVMDIGAMKLSAIMSRSLLKDFVDLVFIIKELSLPAIISGAKQKFPSFNEMIALKSLVYFADVIEEPIIFKNNQAISFAQIQTFLEAEVKKLAII